MNIQEEKLEIVRMVIDTKNPSILQKIRNLFTKENDFWAALSDVEKEDIIKGIEEIENGEKYSYEEIMKKHR